MVGIYIAFIKNLNYLGFVASMRYKFQYLLILILKKFIPNNINFEVRHKLEVNFFSLFFLTKNLFI